MPLRIAVVAAKAALRDALRWACESRGHEVVEARNLRELAKVNDPPCTGVITTLPVPGGTPIDLSALVPDVAMGAVVVRKDTVDQDDGAYFLYVCEYQEFSQGHARLLDAMEHFVGLSLTQRRSLMRAEAADTVSEDADTEPT